MAETDELKRIFEAAADAVKDLPAGLRPQAFRQAVEHMLGSEHKKDPSRRSSEKQLKSRERKASSQQSSRKSSAKGQGRRSRPGGRAAVRELANSGFFKSRRTIADILAHLESKKALRFQAQDISPGLTSLTREGVLEREKNDANKYEYWEA